MGHPVLFPPITDTPRPSPTQSSSQCGHRGRALPRTYFCGPLCHYFVDKTSKVTGPKYCALLKSLVPFLKLLVPPTKYRYPGYGPVRSNPQTHTKHVLTDWDSFEHPDETQALDIFVILLCVGYVNSQSCTIISWDLVCCFRGNENSQYRWIFAAN